jgi:tRNA(Ile)-lysidine synthase
MIVQTVLDTHRQFNLFPPDTTIILAVSGGADSITLLYVMAQLHERLAIKLHVATLNHGLRPDAADDVAYVQRMAESLNVPVSTETVDVKHLADIHNIGIEAAGRVARYDFFARVAVQIGATTIATAHHADDQSETILMHLIRGAGVQGLIGIQPKTPYPNYPELTLIRPLLFVRRPDIEAYCGEHQLNPRHDATNQDTVFLRNNIRHSILPRMRELNPQIDRAFAQLADIVSIEQDFMQTYYESSIQPFIQANEGNTRYSVERDLFRSWHPAMQRRFIKDASFKLGSEAAYVHIMAAVHTAATGEVGAIARLPDAIRLRVGYVDIVIEQESAPMPEADYWLIDHEYNVALPGKTNCVRWILEATIELQPDTVARLHIPPNSTVKLRTRQAGDKFQPLGMGGHSKKLKHWMIDHKIPQHLRDRIPLLMVNDEIATILLPDQWIVAEPYAIKTLSQHNFYFSISKLL